MISEAKTYPMGSIAQRIFEAGGGPGVLVEEGQEDVIAALRLLLKNNGYDVDFVQSPADALTRLRNGNFDACLLDLNYSRDTTSGTEGLELLSRVQELDNTLAVVVMTAWGSIELAVDAMHRGACDFVPETLGQRRVAQSPGPADAAFARPAQQARPGPARTAGSRADAAGAHARPDRRAQRTGDCRIDAIGAHGRR